MYISKLENDGCLDFQWMDKKDEGNEDELKSYGWVFLGFVFSRIQREK